MNLFRGDVDATLPNAILDDLLEVGDCIVGVSTGGGLVEEHTIRFSPCSLPEAHRCWAVRPPFAQRRAERCPCLALRLQEGFEVVGP